MGILWIRETEWRHCGIKMIVFEDNYSKINSNILNNRNRYYSSLKDGDK